MLRLLFALTLLFSGSSVLAQTYTARSLGGPDKAYIRQLYIRPGGDIYVLTSDSWYVKNADANTFTKKEWEDASFLAVDSSGNVYGQAEGMVTLLLLPSDQWSDMVMAPFDGRKLTNAVTVGSQDHLFSPLGNVIVEFDYEEVYDRDTLPKGVSIKRVASVGDTLLAITSTRLFAQVNDGDWIVLDSTLPSAVKTIKHSPHGYIAGTATSGIYILDRIGGEWQFISDNQPDWQINDVLYHNGRIYSANGNNLYTTSDLGQTWIEGKGRIRTMPVNVLAENDGVIYAGTGREGLFISRDEGETWSAYNGGIAESQVRAIYEYKGDIYTGSEINAVHRLSSDRTWTDQNNGIRAGATVTAFADGNDTLYALDDRSGLYKWVADSNAWIKKPLTFTVSSEYMDMDWLDERTLVVISEAVEILDVPTNEFTRTQFGENQIYDLEIANGKMYIAANDGVRMSDDRGENWRMLRAGRSVKVHVFGETIVTQLIDGDIWRSDDAGETWSKFADNYGSMFRAGDLLFARSDDALIYTDLKSDWQVALNDIVSLNELALMPGGRLLAGLNDRGLFELTPVSAVESHEEVETDELIVYPNPASAITTIETDATQVEIYNSIGQLAATMAGPAGAEFSFPTSDLSEGVYTVWARTSNGVRTARLVVLR